MVSSSGVGDGGGGVVGDGGSNGGHHGHVLVGAVGLGADVEGELVAGGDDGAVLLVTDGVGAVHVVHAGVAQGDVGSRGHGQHQREGNHTQHVDWLECWSETLTISRYPIGN